MGVAFVQRGVMTVTMKATVSVDKGKIGLREVPGAEPGVSQALVSIANRP
jgi:hypothetical protein